MKKTNNDKTEEDISLQTLQKASKEASEQAVNESFALGIPVTVLKDGYLVELYPDGTEKRLKKSTPKAKKVTQKHFTIGK